MLQDGEAAARAATSALIAAGTGLGEALLHNVGRPAHSVARRKPAMPTSPRATSARSSLLRDLIERFGRAEVEHVVSGRGLVNIHRVTHNGRCPAVDDDDDPDAPAPISDAALERRCAGCVEALEMFVDAYGAEAGNLALRTVATGGVFVGGGIAPKILPALDRRPLHARVPRQGAVRSMLRQMPVKIILNREAGLLGAAHRARCRATDASAQEARPRRRTRNISIGAAPRCSALIVVSHESRASCQTCGE